MRVALCSSSQQHGISEKSILYNVLWLATVVLDRPSWSFCLNADCTAYTCASPFTSSGNSPAISSCVRAKSLGLCLLFRILDGDSSFDRVDARHSLRSGSANVSPRGFRARDFLALIRWIAVLVIALLPISLGIGGGSRTLDGLTLTILWIDRGLRIRCSVAG